jgi:hypothetical protein
VSEKESDWVLKSGGEADGPRGFRWIRICTGTPLTRKMTRSGRFGTGVLMYDGDAGKYFFCPRRKSRPASKTSSSAPINKEWSSAAA